MDGKTEQAASSQSSREVMPIPSHLAGWVVPQSFEDEVLKASVRCPCGSERVELRYPGATHLSWKDQTPIPSSVKIGEVWFFIIKATCA